MSDHPYITEEEEYLIQATLQLLESRRRVYSSCLSCGSPMRCGPVLVCAECLGHQCEVYEQVAELPEAEDKNKENDEPRE